MRAPHDCETSTDAFTRVAWAYAQNPPNLLSPPTRARSWLPSVAVRMRPVPPLSKGSVAAEPNIQVIRNTYKAELERVQTQGILAGLLFRHFFSGPHIFGVKSFIASIR